MALARNRRDSGMNYWPGFVDALSTLVLSIIFLLTVFMVAQFYLSQQISGKDTALARLNAQISRLSELLSLERTGKTSLETEIAQLHASLSAAQGERERLRGAAEGAQSSNDAGKAEAGRLNSQIDIEKAATARAVAQIEILNQQISALRRQIAALETALKIKETAQVHAEGLSSADLLHGATDEDVAALARGAVAAVISPGSALQQGARPPVRALLDKGVAVALGSDHTPGGVGITSMPLVIALAVSYLGMSVTEALRAATLGGAYALRAPDRGALVRGRLADIVLWDADHEGAFAWNYGLQPRRVWRGGEPATP